MQVLPLFALADVGLRDEVGGAAVDAERDEKVAVAAIHRLVAVLRIATAQLCTLLRTRAIPSLAHLAVRVEQCCSELNEIDVRPLQLRQGARLLGHKLEKRLLELRYRRLERGAPNGKQSLGAEDAAERFAQLDADLKTRRVQVREDLKPAQMHRSRPSVEIRSVAFAGSSERARNGLRTLASSSRGSVLLKSTRCTSYSTSSTLSWRAGSGPTSTSSSSLEAVSSESEAMRPRTRSGGAASAQGQSVLCFEAVHAPRTAPFALGALRRLAPELAVRLVTLVARFVHGVRVRIRDALRGLARRAGAERHAQRVSESTKSEVKKECQKRADHTERALASTQRAEGQMH